MIDQSSTWTVKVPAKCQRWKESVVSSIWGYKLLIPGAVAKLGGKHVECFTRPVCYHTRCRPRPRPKQLACIWHWIIDNIRSICCQVLNSWGYTHIQTSVSSSLERHQAIGEAIVEALEKGLVTSREDLFITCMQDWLPWCCCCFPHFYPGVEQVSRVRITSFSSLYS